MNLSDVFISYRRKDVEFTQKLYEALKESGRDVWVDWEDIQPAVQSFSTEISEGIEGADAFVAILSPNYLESEYCLGELAYAVELHKKIIPVVLTKFDGMDFPQSIASINWIYFTPHAGQENTFEQGMANLIKGLEADYDHAKEHTRLLVRAKEWDSNGRDRSYLLGGAELDRAEAWLTASHTKKPAATELHAQYIMTSRQAATARQRNLLITASVVSVLMAILAVVAFILFQIAERSAAESRSLARAANAQLAFVSNDLDLAILLGLESVDLNNPPIESGKIFAEAVYAPGTRALLQGHEAAIWGVDVNEDGTRAISGDAAGAAILWDLDTGEEIRRYGGGEDAARLYDVQFSPDGTRFLSAGADGSITLWDVESGEALHTMTSEGNESRAVIFGPEGETALSGHADGAVIIWDLDTGEELARFTGHSSAVWSLALSSDGRTVASAGAGDNSEINSVLLLWDYESREVEVERLMEPMGARIVAMDFADDGDALLLGVGDRTVRLWDLEAQADLASMEGHTGFIWDVDLSPDGRLALSVAEDNTVRLWDVVAGEEILRFDGHTDLVYAVSFAEGSHRAVSGSADMTLRYWDLENGQEEARFYGHQGFARSVAFNNDDSIALSGSFDGTIKLWDLARDRWLRDGPEVDSAVTSIAYAPGSDTLLVGQFTPDVLLIDVAANEVTAALEGHGSWVYSVDISDDGALGISSAWDGEAIVWDLVEGEELLRIAPEGVSRLSGAAISPAGRYAAISASTGELFLYDLESGEQVRQFAGHASFINELRFSPDGALLASASSDTNVILWDVETGDVFHRLEDHTGQVNSVNFTTDGAYLVTGGGNGTVRLWDVATGDELSRLNIGGSILSLDISGDDQRVLVGMDDTTVRIWQIGEIELDAVEAWAQENRYIGELTCAERRNFRIDPQCETG